MRCAKTRKMESKRFVQEMFPNAHREKSGTGYAIWSKKTAGKVKLAEEPSVSRAWTAAKNFIKESGTPEAKGIEPNGLGVIDRAIKENRESLESVTVGGEIFSSIPRKTIIRRMPYTSGRVYFDKDQLYFGVSGPAHALADINKENYHLNKWKEETPDSQEISHVSSSLGTLCHVLQAEIGSAIAKGKDMVLGQLFFKQMDKYINDCGISLSVRDEWARKITKAAKCIQDFYVRYKIEPIAYEFCVSDKACGIATPLDLIAYAEVNGERKLCNFNFKFRKNSDVYETDKYQLNIEKIIFNRYMEGTGMQLDHTFIVVPKWNAVKNYVCDVKMMDGLYTEDEFNADIAYLKTKSGWKSHFYPDMDKLHLPVMGLQVGASGLIEENRVSYRTYIESFNV